MRKNKKLIDKLIDFGLDDSPLALIQTYLTSHKKPTAAQITQLHFYLGADSDASNRWRALGRDYIEAECKNLVIFEGFEWFSFKVPGGSYTPDFDYLLEDGSWAIVEVKGSEHQRNYRDARSKLRGAATLNPWFKFFEARGQTGGGFSLEVIVPDASWLANLRLDKF